MIKFGHKQGAGRALLHTHTHTRAREKKRRGGEGEGVILHTEMLITAIAKGNPALC